MARAPGVVTGRYGTIGEVYYITEDFWPHNTTLFVSDFKGNDPRFISYLLKTINFQSVNGKTSVPGIDRKDLHAITVRAPHTQEQKRISSSLGALDDKIELNHRTTKTLEELAGAIFKAWFIDFLPVKAKTAGATCFPGMRNGAFQSISAKLIEDSLGEVPAGWKRVEMSDLLQAEVNGDWGSPILETPDEVRTNAFCLRGTDLPPSNQGTLGKTPVRSYSSKRLSSKMLHPGDIVVEMSGGSPTQSTGRSALITEGLLRTQPLPITFSNFCKALRPINRNQSIFLSLWLQYHYQRHTLEQFELGTTGIKNLDLKTFAKLNPITKPPDQILTAFIETVTPVIALKVRNSRENETLELLRDLILGRLFQKANKF